MACKDQQSITKLVEDFVKKGHNYGFYQSIRWLNGIAKICEQEQLKPLKINITPYLSLDFSGSDIKEMSFDTDKGVVNIVATFLGLYGTVSPLPTFYTEKLIKNVNDNITVEKDFLDMFHNIFYKKIYDMWAKYKLNLMANEFKNDRYIDRTYHLIGLGDKSLRKIVPNAKSLIKYAGLFSRKSRSIVSLQVLLQDYFNIKLNVTASKKIINSIPEGQQLNLGTKNSTLGISSYLGQQAYGYGSNIMVDIYDLNLNQLNLFTLNNEYSRILSFLVKFYCSIPVKCFVKLHLENGIAKNTQLGIPEWGILGQNAWFSANKNISYKTQYFIV